MYPDFTIRHPVTGNFIYWEHLGLMDEWSYAKNASQKIQTYMTNHIYPGINLIITSETKEHPLQPQMISKIIEQYF